jgi:S-phase kinase-associated protein 1
MVRLISKEGEMFELPYNAIKNSALVSTMFDMDEAEDDENNIQEMPVPNVTSRILGKVVEFARHTLEEPMSEIEKPIISTVMSEIVQQWYADFTDIEQEDLYAILLAANFMDYRQLLNLTCAKAASTIRGKTTEELCEQFGFEYNDEPIDEEALKKKYPWAEDLPPDEEEESKTAEVS